VIEVAMFSRHDYIFAVFITISRSMSDMAVIMRLPSR